MTKTKGSESQVSADQQGSNTANNNFYNVLSSPVDTSGGMRSDGLLDDRSNKVDRSKGNDSKHLEILTYLPFLFPSVNFR